MANGQEPIAALCPAEFIYEPLVLKPGNHESMQAMEISVWHKHLWGKKKKAR